jgi:cytoskeletal protein CcmA (bactofilin family)
MFRRRAPRPDAVPAEPQGEAFTYVHEGTIVRGSIEATGRLRVHGTVLGDVRVDGVLEVAAGGLVEGATVHAAEVRVLGTVRAAVTAAVKVEIWQDGTLEGDVATVALDIEEGATFVGRSVMASRSRAVATRQDGSEGPAALDAGAAVIDDARQAEGPGDALEALGLAPSARDAAEPAGG